MKHYAFLDMSGVYVRQAGDAQTVPPGAVEAPFRSDDLISMMLVSGVWTERPRLAAPEITGGTVTFSGLPTGTTCEVVDAETGEELAVLGESAGAIVVELLDAGTYRIEALPPLPHLKHRLLVTVP